jgi:glycosyltransferase involved in cell wall biosynthesis
MARILILTPQLPYPPHQGTTIRNFNLIAGLARRHELDLLTFLAPGQAEPIHVGGRGAGGRGDLFTASGALRVPFSPLQSLCRSIVAEPQPLRGLARRAWDTLANPLPDMALRLASPVMARRLARLIHENEYDVIQVEGIEMAPYLLGLSGHSRLIFDDHNAEYLLQRRAFLTDARRPQRWLAAAYSLAQWWKLTAYERRICRLAGRVVAVSEADRDALRRLAPGVEVTVVPNGVDLDFYRPGVVSPAPGLSPHALVFTGKMDYRPNVDAVLWFAEAVLPLVLAQVPGARFYVVGQQPHARLEALDGRPAITITGRVPDIRPYIAGAAVYVVPLRIGGGTRLKVLEAMAMGEAVVSTRLGCDGFPFEDGRQVRLADSAEDFASVVVELLLRREQAAALGLAARAEVESHYGWDAIVPSLEGLYS